MFDLNNVFGGHRTAGQLSHITERVVFGASWGRRLALSFPIDGDEEVEEVFVQFLGDRPLYESCCAEARLANDGDDANPHRLTASERLAIWVYSSTDDR